MQKITSIHLNGRAYQLEEAGYETLHAYLAKAEARLAANPDKAEIIADLEQAVGEKCARFMSASKNVVTAVEIDQILQEMGPVEEPSVEAGEKTSQESVRSPKRLYLIREGAWFAGVCTGLGAYFDIDPNIVRIAFAVLTVMTGGAWLLVYAALMFFMPYATTGEEHAQAHGVPFNAQEVVNRAKDGYANFVEKSKHHWRYEMYRQKAELRRQRHELKHMRRQAHRGVAVNVPPMHPMRLSPLLGVMSGCLAIVWVLALFSLITTGAIFGWVLPGQIPLWGALLLLFVVYHAIAGPLKASRYASWGPQGGYVYDGRFVVADMLEILFVFACLWFLYDHYPQVQSFVNDIPQNVRHWFQALDA